MSVQKVTAAKAARTSRSRKKVTEPGFIIIGCGPGAVSYELAMGSVDANLRGFTTDCKDVLDYSEEERFKKSEGMTIVGLGDWRKLLARSDANLVICIAPMEMRPEIAIAAAEAGKHLLLEGSIALSYTGGLRLLEAYRNTAARLAVGNLLATVPDCFYLRERIQKYGVRRLSSFSMRTTAASMLLSKSGSSSAVGSFEDVHDVSMITALGRPTSVMASESIAQGDRFSSLKFSVVIDTSDCPFCFHFRLAADPDSTRREYAVRFSDGTRVMLDEGVLTNGGLLMEHPENALPQMRSLDMKIALDYFNGEREDPAHLCPDAALRALQVLEAAATSAKTGKIVRL